MAIGVVVVTFNRLNKLKEALQSFSRQTVTPDYIVVVDNASTDKTPQYLKEWKNEKENYSKYVVTMNRNMGGSGGFYTGLKFAQKLKSDWIWVSDDDAFPERNALEVAEKYLNKNLSAICGMVINNGKIDLDHRRCYRKEKFRLVPISFSKEMYNRETFEVECFSYVGAIINKGKLKLAGLPRKEYFIWMDDTEHSLRLHKYGKIICVPAIKIHHDVRSINANIPTWKDYYGIRNTADMYRRNFPYKYYVYYCYGNLIKTTLNIVKHKNVAFNKIKRKAILDAMHKKMGVNEVYKPGWKYTSE